MSRISLIVLTFAALTLVACKDEDLQATDNTESDMRICQGYNTLLLPPDLSVARQSTEVEFYRFSVLQEAVGTPADVIRRQPEVGRVLFETQVGQWHFVSAVKNAPGNNPPVLLVFAAAHRVGADMALAVSEASISIVGDGSDPEHRAMFEDMIVVPAQERPAGGGFCADGYHFSYGAPALMARFTLALDEAGTGARYDITFSNTPLQAQDDRPAAPSPSIDEMGVSVETQDIVVAGFPGEVTTFSAEEHNQLQVAHQAFVAGQPRPGKMPLVFADYAVTGADAASGSLQRLLSLLETIDGN